MPYYKDSNGELHFLDDDAFAYLLPIGCVEVAENEARAAQVAENEKDPEQALVFLNSERDSLLATASLRIAPLQDAVDLGVATPSDMENLKLWKEYRVALNRVNTQVSFPEVVEWPVVPRGA